MMIACLKRLCRQGPPIRPTILFLSFLAWLFSLLCVRHCNFLLLSSSPDDYSQSQDGAQQHMTSTASSIGLFSQAIYDTDGGTILGCVRYTSKTHLDGMFRAARAFGTITTMWASAAFIFIWTVLLFRPKGSRVLWITSHAVLLAAAVTQGFAFLILGSEQCQTRNCMITGVGVMAIFNIIVLSTLSAVLFLEPTPKTPWLIWWKDKNFVENRVTLALSGGGSAQFEEPATAVHQPPSADPGKYRLSDANANSSIGFETEYDGPPNILPVLSGEQSEVTQQSVQESLVSSVGLQHLTSFRLVTFALIVVSWAISIVGVQRCSFLLVGPEAFSASDYSGLGLFTRAAYYDGKVIGCIAYPSDTKTNFDSAFQASRVFGSMTAFFMTAVLILGAVQLFVQVAKAEIWFVLRALLPCAVVAQLLTFILFRTEICTDNDMVDCFPGATGVVVILNVFLMLALCALVWLMPPPSNPLFMRYRGEPQGEEEVDIDALFDRGSATKTRHLDPTPHKHASDDDTLSDSQDDLHGDHEEETVSGLFPHPERIETNTVRVKYEGHEKKAIKKTLHSDGSKTITMTIEELLLDMSLDDSSNEERSENSSRAHSEEL